MMIVDERINDYVLHSVESILLLVIFAIVVKSNSFTEITYLDVLILNFK